MFRTPLSVLSAHRPALSVRRRTGLHFDQWLARLVAKVRSGWPGSTASPLCWLCLATSLVLLGGYFEPTPTCTAQSTSPAATQPPVQNPDSPETPDARETPNARETPDGPEAPPGETYYVRDREGRLVPLVGWQYEELIQRLGSAQETVQPAGCDLTELVTEVVERDDWLDLTLRLQLQWNSAGWQKVDLGLESWLPTGKLTGLGASDYELRKNEAGRWELLVRGEVGQTATVTLQGMLVKQVVGPVRRLELRLAKAPLSRLHFTPRESTDQVALQTLAGDRLPLQRQPTEAVEGSAVHWEAQAVPSEALLFWGLIAPPAQSSPGALEANLNLELRVEGPQSWGATVDLEVAGYGEPVESFELLLPPGTRLLPHDPADPSARFNVEPMGASGEAADTSSSPESAQRVRIRLHAAQPRARIRLNAVTQLGDADVPAASPVAANAPGPAAGESTTWANSWMKCADYVVQGAIRQTGRVRLFASDDWAVQWQDTPAVRNADPGAVAPSALSAENQSELLAAFAIYNQPCGLQLQVRPRESRIEVEPHYWIRVVGNELELTGRLVYRLRGARAARLEIDANGWQETRITATGAGIAEDAIMDDVQPLTVQLPARVRGELEIELTARRPWDRQAVRWSIPLPQPTGNRLATHVVLATPSGMSATAVLSAMPGALLEVSGAPTTSDLPPALAGLRSQEVRFPRDATATQLVVDIMQHPREIELNQTAKVRVGLREIQVRQVFSYEVTHEPLSSALFRIPSSLSNLSQIVWTVNGTRVMPLARGGTAGGPESSPTAADSGNNPGGRQLTLPVTGGGTFEVVATYSVPVPALSLGPLPLSIPLLASADAEPDLQEAHWTRDAGAMQVEPYAASGWVSDEQLRRRIGCDLALTTAQPLDQCTVIMRPAVQGASPRTMVRGAWVQTWLAADSRFDRAVYELESREQLVILRMPRGFDSQQTLVTVNGTPVPVEKAGESGLMIRLPELRDGRALVEVAYRVPHSVRWWQSRIELPEVEQAVWMARWVWQVVVARQQHLFAASANLTSLDRWDWKQWYWAREVTWQQADLEAWLHASQQPPVPQDANQYTFTSLHAPAVTQLWLVDQRTLVLCGAGVGVVLVIVWANFAVVRHWGLLVPAAFALLWIGLWAPTPAVMIGQAAVGGIILAVTSRLFVNLWHSRRVAGSSGHSTRFVSPSGTPPRPSTVTSAPMPGGKQG